MTSALRRRAFNRFCTNKIVFSYTHTVVKTNYYFKENVNVFLSPVVKYKLLLIFKL